MAAKGESLDYRSFFRRSPSRLCVLAGDGRVLDASHGFAALFGRQLDDLVGRSIVDLAHPDDRAATSAALERLAEGSAAEELDQRCSREDGSYQRVSLELLADRDTGLVHGAARDVAARDELRHFKALADATSDFICIAALTGTVLYVNPAGMRLLGRGEDEYQGKQLADLAPPTVLDVLKNRVLPALRKDGRCEGELEFPAAGGRAVPISHVSVLLRNAAGQPEAVAMIARDLTGQHEDQASLKRFKALIEAMPDFVGISGMDGKIHYVNQAGMALSGRAGEDYRSLSILDFTTPDALERYRDDIMPEVMRSGAWVGEGTLLRADGTIVPVSRIVVLIRDAAGRPDSMATTARDLTPQKRLEEALRRSLHEMATPIIEVWDGVLALPVIGLVDSGRAAQMMQVLLDAVSRTQCRVAILDLTGVSTIDTSTVHHLFQMVQATSLLGSECVVSGITGPVAQIVTNLGIDFSDLRTFRTLRDALRFAVRHAALPR